MKSSNSISKDKIYFLYFFVVSRLFIGSFTGSDIISIIIHKVKILNKDHLVSANPAIRIDI